MRTLLKLSAFTTVICAPLTSLTCLGMVSHAGALAITAGVSAAVSVAYLYGHHPGEKDRFAAFTSV